MPADPSTGDVSVRLIGCGSLVETPDPREWDPAADGALAEALSGLRKRPEAAYLGLAMPRFLLRMPYGERTDPVDGSDFEEVGKMPAHDDYLWGDPALFCLRALGRSFAREGWQLRFERHLEIQGLLVHVFGEGAGAAAKPCAEARLSESAARRMMDLGVMPLLSLRDRDAVRLGRFRSFADPPARLAGRWEAHE
jgi:type VI secretion system protein ImpC